MGRPKGKRRRNAVASGERDPVVLLKLSAEARAAGDHRRACQLARRAAARRPDDARVLNALGISLAAAGELEQALETLGKTVRLEPGFAEGWYNLGQVRERLGHAAEALAAYRRAHEAAPQLAAPAYNYGGALLEEGRARDAIAPLRAAVEAQPDFAAGWGNLGSAQRLAGRPSEALASFEQAVALDPELVSAWSNLGLLHKARGEDQAALSAFERVLELDPDHATARHMAAALRGQTPSQSDHRYVAALFDDFASRFDESLEGELAYRVPDAIAGLLREHVARGAVLDLGCGTGLLGARLRGSMARLVGVDLSPQMIARARAKGDYDALEVASIEEVLARDEDRFDVITAADVLVYCGALGDTFAGVARRLRHGGLFAFSIETHDGEEPYVLRPTGRYAHRPSYVAATAREAGLQGVVQRDLELRLNASAPVMGRVELWRAG